MAGEREDFTKDPDFNRYLDRLWSRLPGFAERAAGIKTEAPGSIEQFGRMGKFWWTAREAREMSRKDIAQGLAETPQEVETMVDNVRFFEVGLGEPTAYRGSFPQRYSDVLGDSLLYKQYCKIFDIHFEEPQEPISN